MKLKYYKALPTNFGDDLNPFIFEKIFGEDFHKLCNDTLWESMHTQTYYTCPFPIQYRSTYREYGESSLKLTNNEYDGWM